MDLKEQHTNDGLEEQRKTPETSEERDNSSKASAAPLSEAQKADKVAELLARGAWDNSQSHDEAVSDAGGSGDSVTPDETGGEAKGRASNPLASPTDLAEALGVSPKDVYKLPIAVGDDGETVTLGALKDAYKGRAEVASETIAKVSALNEREAALIVEQQTWSTLAADPNIPRSALDGARKALGERMQREGRKFLDMVPELKDETKLDAFRSDMVETLGKFGYQPHEVVLSDARQALLIRDYMRTKRQLDTLLKETRPKPPNTSQPQGRGGKPRAAPKPKHSHDAQLSAVSALLKGH